MRAGMVRRTLRGLALPLAVGLSVFSAPSAWASTEVDTFTAVDSTAVGCSGASIASIAESNGVHYYFRGRRLRFPTKVLPFDELGSIELSAEPTRGHTVTQRRYQLLAPSTCFTDVHPGMLGRFEPTQSWCAGESNPFLEQVFDSDELDLTATWSLVRRSNHHVVAAGQLHINLGVGPVDFPVPAGLPLGRYVLLVRDAASSPTLYPYSLPVEQYTCLRAPEVGTGSITFRVPRGGPGVDLHLVGDSSPIETVVHVRAGHSYTYTTAETAIRWVAYAHGNHVGNLGFGSLEVPQLVPVSR